MKLKLLKSLTKFDFHPYLSKQIQNKPTPHYKYYMQADGRTDKQSDRQT